HPLNFTGADAVLGCARLHHDREPRANADLGPVEDRVRQHGELTTALGALPDASWTHGAVRAGGARRAVLRGEEVRLVVATVGADRIAVPAQVFKEDVGVGLVLDPI